MVKLKPYQIETNDGQAVISITACNADWANIAVHLTGPRRDQWGGSVQHQVSLPGFEFMVGATYGTQLGGRCYDDMPDEVYRAYIDANRPAILALIDWLNTPGNVPVAAAGGLSYKRRKVR